MGFFRWSQLAHYISHYYHLVMTNSSPWKITIEIVDLAIDNMVIFHSYVNVYQRVFISSPISISNIELFM